MGWGSSWQVMLLLYTWNMRHNKVYCRGTGIKQEWKFETRAKLEAGDALMTATIKNTTTCKLPNVSPTGSYSGPATCSSGANRS